MICEKCGKEHDDSVGSGRFCSKACANSRIRSKETREKVSLALKGRSIFHLQTKEVMEKRKATYLKNHPKKILTCFWCGTRFEKKHRIPKSGRVYCNGTCRNKHLNSLKLMGGNFNNGKTPKWEILLENILNDFKIKYVHNCRDILPDALELDFWLPNEKIGIELNGIFHYSERPYGSNIEAFNRRKQKDIRKIELMKELGYKLIIVDYRDAKRDNKGYFIDLIKREILNEKPEVPIRIRAGGSDPPVV